MLIKKNSMIQRKFWMNFISYIQANRAKYRNNYQQKWAKKLHSCKHEFSKKRIMLRAYQDWLKLVNDLVKIWFRFDSDMTQHSFSFSTLFFFLNTLFLSQHSFLSSTSCSSTSFSFHVINTFLSSLAQSLNIT